MGQFISRKVVLSGAAVAGGAAWLGYLGTRPESQLLGPALVAGDDPNEIALTFDDGPNDRSTRPLLDVLHRFQVRATFFMIGEFVRQRPEIVREVHAAGHLIGNHTLSHPFLANKSLERVEQELRDCNRLLEDVLGAPVRYFRAPYGARRPAVLRKARELGLEPVQWNVTGKDWEAIGVGGILRRLERGMIRARRAGRGANLLLHDGSHTAMGADRSATARAIELLLWKAHQDGRSLVTVDAWDNRRAEPRERDSGASAMAKAAVVP